MTGPVVYLAYFRMNVDYFMGEKPTKEDLKYCLVPQVLPEAGKTGWTLRVINANGQPQREPVIAMPAFLRSLRRPEIRLEENDPVEVQLIQKLQGRAGAAGHVLPTIVPTDRMPPWSRMVLPTYVVLKLQQLGGAGNMQDVRG